MKQRRIQFFIIAFIFLNAAVWAQTEKVSDADLPVIKVAFSDDQSIVTERILYMALKRSGYQMIAKATGMRTSIADVNYGDAAILPAQTDGLDIINPNLGKIHLNCLNCCFYSNNFVTFNIN